MTTTTVEESPLAAAVRIFGVTGALLLAMLLTLHPQSMYSAMQGVMTLMK